MPREITQAEFNAIVANQHISELRVKNQRKNDKEGHYKLKLRGTNQLYTLRIKDQKKMKELIKIAQDKAIAIKKIN